MPAAEWLLDNYHLVQEQIREIRDDLPPGYYRQLPKLADGPFAGYPRVFGLSWALVAHTDSRVDPESLRRFIVAYQRIQPLTIGELWAMIVTLRIVLVENLRRLADQMTAGRKARRDADALADLLLAHGSAQADLQADTAAHASEPLSEPFAGQLAKRLRDLDPTTTPALGWLEERLERQGGSIEEMVEHVQRRQGASNVTVRNIITSMRLMSNVDWAELVESVSLVDQRLCAESAFAAMDFPTRDIYRGAIEQLSRGSSLSELAIAGEALKAAQAAAAQATDPREADRVGDPGYHLIAGGRRALEQSIGFRAPARLSISRLGTRLGIGGYVGAILGVTAIIMALALWALAGVGVGWLALFAVVAFLPATEIATTLVNRGITWTFGAITLPGLDLKAGVPTSSRTLVVVPTLLTNAADLLEQVERLEVHYLGSAAGDLTFALLSDGVDADEESLEGDEHLLTIAAEAVERLNHRHGPGLDGDRFLLLHRHRVFNAGEKKWMGWERKRGKLCELNRLLRGATDTTFMPVNGRPPRVPSGVRYVITLDADTRLPRDAVPRLVGKMAHPLNRPKFDSAEQRVVDGYGILQPRVTPSLPIGREGSLFQRVFSGPGGMDPYAAAVSDVYQDLFGEGSYTGKGIYDVDAFESALAGRMPENAVLSHDLLEGIFARAGLASDVEVVEEFPSRYDVAARRQHRWTRGDWQLLPWALGRVTGRQAVPAVGRGKIVDNLRRSLFAPFTLATVAVSWLLPLSLAIWGTLFALAAIAIPAFFPTLFAIIPRRAGVRLGQSRPCPWRRLAAGWRPDRSFDRVPARPRLANGRCDRANDGAAVPDPPSSSRMDDGGTIGVEPAPGPARLLSRHGKRDGARAVGGGRRAGAGAVVVAGRASDRIPLADGAGAGLAYEPVADRRTEPRRVRIRGARSAPHRPADMALLRDVRHRLGQHAATGQFPGGAEAGRRASDIADQHRSLPAFRRCRARFRLGGNQGDRRAS